MDEFTSSLQDIGVLLGFASAEIAWAYIGCILASLLCVVYGLIMWNSGGKSTPKRRGRRGRRVKKGRRPRRRR